jgi:serine protease Do
MSADASSPEAVPSTKPHARVLVVSAAALALAATAGVAIGFVWGGGGPAAVADPAKVPAAAVQVAAAPTPMMLGASGYMPSLADIVERVAPAVVSLKAKVTGTQQDDVSDQDLENLPPSLREFFERNRRNRPNRPRGEVQGSGFVVDSSGYIVTNNHVVANATEIEVGFADGKKYKAKIVGRDEPTDVAVIKIEGSRFPAVTFADDSRVRVGDWVLAVGNPFGLGGTVTAGIVSARGRDDVGGTTYTDYLQIDAAINRGNSGGPTFDMSGRVIGMNVAIYSPSGTSAGIGFAIPSSTVQRVVSEIRKSGSVTRGWLGVQIQSLSEDTAQALGLPNANGAIVAEVISGSPAEKAGFKQGDVVLKMNGTAVKDNRDLTRRVGGLNAGETATFVVWRDNREMTITVTIAKRPDEQKLSQLDSKPGSGGDSKPGQADVAALGLSLSTITPLVRQELGLENTDKGVVITDVDPDSDAAERGLRPGIRILSAGGKDVRSPSDVSAAVAQAKSLKRPSVLLFVDAGGRKAYVPVKIK